MTEALKRAAEERMLLNQQRQNDQLANVTTRRGNKRGSKTNGSYDAGKFFEQINIYIKAKQYSIESF